MTEKMEIGPRDHGLVRVFALDLEGEEIVDWKAPGENGFWALQHALGAKRLDPEKVEVFPADTLQGMGLSTYLIEGAGVDPAELSGDRARLDAVRGALVVIPSSAFAGIEQTLTVAAPLRHLGTYREEASDVAFHPLPGAAAEGLMTGTPSRSPDPGRAPRASVIVVAAIAVIALVALAFGLATE